MKMVRSACPLNCPDSCGFLVEVRPEGLRLHGDGQNPITKGFVCSKGQALLERVSSPDRLRFPLKRAGEGWARISWDEAYDLVAGKIKQTLKKTGSWGILHHYDYGHNGALRNLDRRFFQALGGVTEPDGSMCWGAGKRAQELDFGAMCLSDWEDLYQAKTIILWGRDPALTNIHLMPYLLEAKKKGARLLVINPVRVKSAEFADEFISVRPGSDGALALGLSHIVLKEGWLDWEFVRAHVHGLEEFALRAKEFPPERTAELTGIELRTLTSLAYMISHARPVSFLLGFGLQRYEGGGGTVRAIDALAALTGNVGVSGAGVQYGHQYHRGRLRTLLLPPERYQARLIPHARLAEALANAEPPIELAVVTRSNPLVQQPNSVLWREVWHRIPFKVVLDTVMSETARQADLVLPVTTVFEEEDLIYTSWGPMIQYAQPVLKPQAEARPELEIFTELARRLGLEQDFPYSAREWLEYILAPLEETDGITLEKLSQGALHAPYIPTVAWAEKKFSTPSGKIELASEQALAEAGDAVAAFVPAGRRQDAREFPWYLVTPHPAKGLHSQFQDENGFTLYIHPELAEKRGLRSGDWAVVETKAGQLKALVTVSEAIHPETVVVPEGATAEGFGVNQLIESELSDLGKSTSYYDIRCEIRKWRLD